MSYGTVSLSSLLREASGFANVESPAAPAPAAPAPAPLASRETLRLNKLWRETLAQRAERRSALALARYTSFKGTFAESEKLHAEWQRLHEQYKRANARWFAAWDEYLAALKD